MMGIYWSIITSKLNKTHIIMYFCDWRFWVSIFPVVFTSFIDHSSLMTCYWVEFSHKIHRSSFICGNSEDFSHVSLWARWDYVGHSTVLIKLPLLVMIRFIKAVKYTIYPTGGGWKLCVFSFSFFLPFVCRQWCVRSYYGVKFTLFTSQNMRCDMQDKTGELSQMSSNNGL